MLLAIGVMNHVHGVIGFLWKPGVPGVSRHTTVIKDTRIIIVT